jgi:hypothetical protein
VDQNNPPGATHPLGTLDEFKSDQPELVLREIARYIEDALPRFALHGAVHLSAGSAYIDSSQGKIAIDLGTLPRRWNHLDEASRRAASNDVVRQVTRQRARPVASRQPLLSLDRLPLAPLGAVVVLSVGGFFLFRSLLPSSLPPAEPGARARAAQAAPETSEARTRRVCESTQARVARGATVSIADTDGWVVEFSALRSFGAPAYADALRAFVGEGAAQGRFIWPEEPNLARISATGAGVRTEAEPLTVGDRKLERVTVIFEGAFVDPYFREEERSRYFHVASAMATSLSAHHAGLYARCAHTSGHYLGSWFRGPSEGGAATALLFLVGAFAEPPHIAGPFLKPLGQGPDLGYAFANIEAATVPLTRAKLSDVMGKSQGMVTGPPKAPLTLTFGFPDGSSASRASRELARTVGLLGN